MYLELLLEFRPPNKPMNLRRTSLPATLSLLTLALAGCRPHDFPEYPANYREYAYVANADSNTVSVFDVVNLRLDRELSVGPHPVAVAANPVRNEVYVLSGTADSGAVAVVDAEKNAILASISVHRQPTALEVDATGERVYVTNSGSNSVSVIDLKTRREIAQISVGEEPVALRLSPDGKTLAIANRHAGSLTLVDPHHLATRAHFEGCPGATDVIILPDSSKAYVACSTGHQLMVIALARTASAANPALSTAPDRLEALLDVGQQPVHLALKPDGGEVFVSNAASDSVSEVITGTDDVQGAYTMGAEPRHGLVSANNSLLYVSNYGAPYLSLYAIDDGKRIGSIHVGDGPTAMAFSQAGNLLFVVDSKSDDVAAVRTSTRSLFTMLSAGRNPVAIAIKSFTAQ